MIGPQKHVSQIPAYYDFQQVIQPPQGKKKKSFSKCISADYLKRDTNYSGN